MRLGLEHLLGADAGTQNGENWTVVVAQPLPGRESLVALGLCLPSVNERLEELMAKSHE